MNDAGTATRCGRPIKYFVLPGGFACGWQERYFEAIRNGVSAPSALEMRAALRRHPLEPDRTRRRSFAERWLCASPANSKPSQ